MNTTESDRNLHAENYQSFCPNTLLIGRSEAQCGRTYGPGHWGNGVLGQRGAGATGAGATGCWGNGVLGQRRAGATACWGNGVLGQQRAGATGCWGNGVLGQRGGVGLRMLQSEDTDLNCVKR